MQELIVALIVLVAAVYAASKYLPRAWREKIVFVLSAKGLPQARLASMFNTEASCGSGCGSCGSDSSCAAPALNLDDDDTAPATGRRIIKIHSRS
jgi:hypothetical protein